MDYLLFTYNLCSCAPGELVVVEHAVLDRRLTVHLVNIVVREPKQQTLGDKLSIQLWGFLNYD